MQNLYFCLNNSSTLSIYIHQEIPKLIIEILIQNDELNYSKLYNMLILQLNLKISYTTFDKYIDNLLKKEIIKKREVTRINQKISSTFFSLSTKGKNDYNLGILDIQITTNKNRILYQLLLFFECYKRSNILTQRQFKNFLKIIGINFENMEQMDMKELEQIKQYIPFNVTNAYKTYNNISIAEYTNSSNPSKYYYVVLPGFSIDEFFYYLRVLQKCNEPHPFSEMSKCLEIPYIHFHYFSKEKISEAVQLLKKFGIIKLILSIYPEETRYDICHDSVKKILYDYWFLHIFDFHLSFQRLVYDKKPSDAVKEYMKLYLGEKKLNHKLALIYDLRRKNKEEFEKEIQEKYGNIEELKVSRNKILENIQKAIRLLKENDIYILSLVKEICLTHENII